MTTLTVNSVLAGTTPVATLTLPVGQKNGSTAWTGSVSIDQTGGTLWRYVHLSSLVPDAASIKANGQSSTPAATGVQSFSGSGLTAETSYRISYYHENVSAQGSNVARSTVFTTDALGSGSGTVTIDLMGRSDLQVAPDAVWLRANVSDSSVTQNLAIASYDESFHKLTYIWDFGDPGATSDKLTNVPVAHNDLNKAYGKHAAHVYSNPGTYTVTCTVYAEDRTLVGVATRQFVVSDPDVVFAGNKTILLDPAGVGDSTTYPGSQVVTTVSGARDLNTNTAGACRILVKKGVTINTSDRFSVTNPATTNLYVSTYGSGARPVMNMSNGIVTLNNAYTGDTVITGLDFYGPYDELTQSGATVTGIDGWDSSGSSIKMVHDCTLDGYKLAVHPTEAGSDANWVMTVVSNTKIRNAGNYSCYARGNFEKVAFLGSSMTHNPLAAATGSGIGDGNSQGNVRFNGSARGIMSVCELFSKFGWSQQSVVEEQSTVRNNTNNTASFMAIYDRVVAEAGWEVWNSGDNQSTDLQTNNILLEKCLLLGSSTTQTLMQIGNVGITVRNTIMVRPNSPFKNGSWKGFLQAQGNADFANPNARLTCINCTFVQAQSSSNHTGVAQDTIWNNEGRTFNTFQNLNGVLYTPNNTGVQPFDPVFSASDLPVAGGGNFDPRYAGFRQRTNSLETQFATPDDAVKIWRPGSGSPLIGAASGVIAYDDYFGAVRPSSASTGAIEVL